jgi:hypothetical protein
MCALLASWDAAPSLRDRFENAHALAGVRRGKTYQGFIKALLRRGVVLVLAVRRRLCAVMQERVTGLWTIHGWVVFAVDGSRFDAPRTKANEQGLGIAGGKGTGPQMLVTILMHLGSCTLWNWRIGTVKDHERRHCSRLVGSTPVGCLLVADAGFVGFDCLRGIIAGGRHVLVRLAGNTRLISGLTGRQDVAALWPKTRQRSAAPLLLRVIRIPDGAGGLVLLGTDVLDQKKLSDKHAAEFYRMRWGVEVCYRSLKQTLERRRMRSGAPRRARLELHWTLLGYMALSVLTLSAMGRRRHRRRWSVAEAIRLIRHAAAARTADRSRCHLRALRNAITPLPTRRARDKSARDWPHKKTCRPPGPPHIRAATKDDQQRLKSLTTP